MFSTNGANSKLIIMGRKNHKISIDGGQSWSDPSSYTQVKDRTTTTAKGQEVVVNSGALLAAYTTFEKNATVYNKGIYHYLTKGSNNAVVDNEVKDYNGGAISMHGTLKACAFYNSSIKNNHLGLGNADGSTADFGGGLAITGVSGASAMTGGIWFNKCTIMGNCCQYGHGGGIASYSDGGDGSTDDKLVFRDTDFKYNCQSSPDEKHGGGLWHRDTNRKCQIYNSNFIGNYAHGLTAGGGGISNEGHLELEGCTFDGNMADNSFGGALYARPYTGDYVLSVSVKGCTFQNNTCTRTSDMASANCELDRGSGGAIMVALVTVHDCTANLVIDGTSSFTGNHADRNGGAIAMTVSSTFQDDLDLASPTATIDANLELKKVTISGNSCGRTGASWTPAGSRYGYGGAIYLSYFNLKVTGSNADVQAYNNSAQEYGGTVGIYKGNVTMSSGTFGIANNPNTAPYGGGFYVNRGTVNFNGGIIASNTASQSGGGVYVQNGNFNMKGGTIGGSATADGNSATAGHGGGVYVATGGICTINGGTIGYNKAANGNGGGFYVDPGTSGTTTINSNDANTSISNNTAKNGGGAFINTGTLNVAATNSRTTQVLSNTATINGGGMYANGKVSLTGVNLNGNTAQGSGDANGGGGIYVTGSNNNTISGGTVNGNHATNGNGGGVYVTSGTSNTLSITGTTQIDSNDAKKGGGVYVAQGKLSVTGTNASNKAHIESNTAAVDGGGVYVAAGSVTASNASIDSNEATSGNGGGIYAVGAVTLTGGSVNGNQASSGNGGGIYAKAGSNTITVQTSAEVNSNEAQNGAGIFAESGTVQITSSQVSSNTADTNGGGIYAQAGSVLANSATINGNTAEGGNGGGIYALSQVTVTGGTVSNNLATSGKGGGIYAKAGSNTITVQTSAAVNGNEAQKGGGIYAESGSVQVTSSTLSGNIADVDGGGVYAEGGAVTMTSATLSSNQADIGDGGGIYGGGGNITVNGGSLATNQADSGNGGGVYATSGTITFNSSSKAIPTFTGNSAQNGGVLFMEGGTCNINAGTLGGSHANRNKAAENGGAIYADNGTVNFATGEISYNTAGLAGGGLYVATDGTLNMTGNVTLDYNHVPSGKHGGGVYLAGVLQIGASTARTISAQYNFADGTVDTDPASVTITPTNRNNVYLPTPVASSSAPHKDVITVVKNGLTTSTRVGFSVPSNFVPVIYCDETSPYTYLRSFLTPIGSGGMKETVFDDASKYVTVHYPDNSFYNPQHIYLSGGTWVDHVTAQPSTGFAVSGDDVTISSNEGLAYLIRYVNGNNADNVAHTDINVTLEADVDMGDYAWVPMASTGASAYSGDVVFTGTFNGNGHTVSNLICQYLGTQTGNRLGLFGTLGSSATVEGLQLKGAKVNTANMSSGSAYLGAIAGQTGGTIRYCSVDAELSTLYSGTVMGGLVGLQSGGTIHSSSTTPEMEGYTMGGLVGQLTGGNLYNSFASTGFTSRTGNTSYMGGLVAENAGHVENCYSIVRGTAPTTTYFGYLAGNNTSASDKGLYYCYASDATYVSTTSSATQGNKVGLGTYGATSVPVLYRHRDTQVTATNDYVPTAASADKQLLLVLNRWVDTVNAHQSAVDYSRWVRPMQTNDSKKSINGDYPLLRLPAMNAVAATSGSAALDYGDINTLIDNYRSATENILFYGAKEGMDSNDGSGAALFIDENAVLTPSGSDAIVATVGVTLDNSAGIAGANPSFGGSDAIDWHFFSSVLTDAPIGLEYGDENEYGLGVYPSWQATFTAANGYFPTNLDSYYDEWDLYGYCEPEYHWINYKRNSASHWHEDWPGIHIYPYSNDTEFVPGRGYMVALKDEGYLQAYGTLNTNSGTGSDFITVPVTYTPSISWTTREGHNLLGNPYQSYLDFWEFARDDENKTLWGEGRTPFYIIIDEDKKDYVLYTVGQSPNPQQASRFLHPHQGFMIDVDQDGSARFSNAMRTTSTTVTSSGSSVTWPGDFRGGEDSPCYPLVNLMVTDDNGNRDIVTVELGRPDKGGAVKEDAMRMGKGSLWCRYEDEDYALVFTQPGLESASIRFACDEDAQFTMTWSTHNGAFSYLHLIDNMTGNDIDCLQKTEYTFTAKTTDYVSRFRLVFDYTGVEENEGDGPSAESETFAYYADGEIHLAEPCQGASLQIIDMQGRVIVSGDAARPVSTNGMAAGVYVLRLTSDNGTRTQKIILN